MELKETVDGMLSEDYRERFIAEYNQAVIRRDKLEAMLDKYFNNKLDFELTNDIGLLVTQTNVMSAYINILRLRAEKEEIKLDYPPRVS